MNTMVRKLLIFALVMAVLAVAGWSGRKFYKKATERRLVAQARQYLEKNDIRNAGLSLQRVLQLNPRNVQAVRLMADFLEAGQMPAAISWRTRAAQLEPERPAARLEWACTALKLGDLKSAKEALDGLGQKDKQGAEYHKLAGALAWGARDGAAAEKHYGEALRLEPNSMTIQMNLATIRLSSTNAAVAAAARRQLELLSTNAAFQVATLRVLVAEAITSKAVPEAIKYCRQMVQSTNASFNDHLGYLSLLRESKAPESAGTLAALKQRAAKNPADAFALGQWLGTTEGLTNALAWLQSLPAEVRTNQPVPVLLADCMMGLADWKGVISFIGKQDWGELNGYRFAMESLAQRKLNQKSAATAAWQKARRFCAKRLDRLARLARTTLAWQWRDESIELLTELCLAFPKESWAADQLSALYYAEGNTKELADFLTKLQAADPSNVRLKNNLANVYLLRNMQLEKAHRLAREAYDANPSDPFVCSTYSYSLLLQQKQPEALQILGGINTNYLKIPSVAAYYGVVQARSGHRELAREPLAQASKAQLLPEENELVKLALAQR